MSTSYLLVLWLCWIGAAFLCSFTWIILREFKEEVSFIEWAKDHPVSVKQIEQYISSLPSYHKIGNRSAKQHLVDSAHENNTMTKKSTSLDAYLDGGELPGASSSVSCSTVPTSSLLSIDMSDLYEADDKKPPEKHTIVDLGYREWLVVEYGRSYKQRNRSAGQNFIGYGIVSVTSNTDDSQVVGGPCTIEEANALIFELNEVKEIMDS